MRQLLVAFILLMVFFMGMRSMCTAESRRMHQEELEQAVERSIRHSLSESRIKKRYPIQSNEELYADFLGDLMTFVSEKDSCTITVYQLDAETGVLDVQVEIRYTLPGGVQGSSVCRKSAVVTEV